MAASCGRPPCRPSAPCAAKTVETGLDRYKPLLPALALVGSDPREVESLLARAAGSHRAVLGLELEEAVGRLTAVVTARPVGEGVTGPFQPWLAIAESGFSTPVGRGENADRTLRNDHVVRRLEPLGAPTVVTAAGAEWRAAVDLDPGWQPDRLQLVAFLQEPATGGGATQTALVDR